MLMRHAWMRGRAVRLRVAQVLVNEALRKLSPSCERASTEERANALLERRRARGAGNRRQHRRYRAAPLPLAMHGMKSEVEEESSGDGQRIAEPRLSQDGRQLEARGSAGECDTFSQQTPSQGCAGRHHGGSQNRPQSDAFWDFVQDDGYGQGQPDTERRSELCGYEAPAIQRAVNRRSQHQR